MQQWRRTNRCALDRFTIVNVRARNSRFEQRPRAHTTCEPRLIDLRLPEQHVAVVHAVPIHRVALRVAQLQPLVQRATAAGEPRTVALCQSSASGGTVRCDLAVARVQHETNLELQRLLRLHRDLLLPATRHVACRASHVVRHVPRCIRICSRLQMRQAEPPPPEARRRHQAARLSLGRAARLETTDCCGRRTRPARLPAGT